MTKQRLTHIMKRAIGIALAVVCRSTASKASNRVAQTFEPPKRILLLNGAHLGDVIIATSVIPILRSAYPSAEIGFLCGSWSQAVVKNNPEISHIHCVDHWRLNRSNRNFAQKSLRYFSTRRTALRDIRGLQYDVAICLCTYFPDFLGLASRARIPIRIGFRESLFAPLATDLVDEPQSPLVPQGARLAEMLRPLAIHHSHFLLRHSTLPPSTPAAIEEVRSLLNVPDLKETHYRIVHMGSGMLSREFPADFWRELAEKLSRDWILLFTGRGRREAENISLVISGLSNCLSACDRLSWDGFVAATRYADVVYSVDSMAGHLAAAVRTRCIAVHGGVVGVARWRPEGEDTVVFTNHVPCSPCGQPKGCAAMTCMKGFGPDDLIRLG